jgi:hypothetical protein
LIVIHTFSGKIIGVKILFDDITGQGTDNVPRLIEKVSADYEAAKDAYITRTQFPLTLAYAGNHIVMLNQFCPFLTD